MARKRRKKNIDEMNGDMTSMIDVVFLLLIFFILMPFKSVEAKLESHLPKTSGPSSASPQEEDIEKIDVKMKRLPGEFNTSTYEGVEVTINGKKIGHFQALNIRLAEIKATLKVPIEKVPLELNANEDVPFFFVLKGLDYGKANGFVNIKFPEPPILNWGKKPVRNK